MEGDRIPAPLVQRYEAGQLLPQDILGGIEAFACATLGPDHAAETWGAREEPEAFGTPAQIAALGCGYALDFPWEHPERVRAFDSVRRTVVTVANPLAALVAEVTVEIGRVQIDRFGIGVLERIATYAFLGPTVGGVPVPGFGVILGGPTGQTVTPAGPGSASAVSDPSPFPFPAIGVDGVTSPEIDLRFHLINYEFSRQAHDDEPPWFTGREQDIPGVDVIPPWNDMRYQWGAKYTQGHQFVVGGHSLLRLFCRIRMSNFGSLEGAYLKLVSRLAGFRQLAGPWRAAEGSALHRSW
jgi:hypothetical protein